MLFAGDIAGEDDCVLLPSLWFPNRCPKITICGNHEFYAASYDAVIRRCRLAANKLDTSYFLEQDEIVLPIKGSMVRILGCTLWTDFTANGDDLRSASISVAKKKMNDFRVIDFRGHIFTPEDSISLHDASLAWMQERLSAAHDGPTIVVTHHAPSSRSQPPRFVGGELAPAFASNLEDLIVRHQPTLWVHGHTHWSVDYMIGKTRIYSNQRGYPREECRFSAGVITL